MFKKVRQWISFANDLVGIGGFFGWTAGGLYAAAAVAVGWLTNIPWFWIVVGSPIAAAFFLLCFALYGRVRPKPRTSDLINKWKGHPAYSVWIAACLWVNEEPWPTIDSTHPAYPSLQKIKSALATGQIESLYGNTNMTAQVARSELVKLAEQYGDRPGFLFPR